MSDNNDSDHSTNAPKPSTDELMNSESPADELMNSESPADEAAERLHRATIEFGLTADQAEEFEALAAAIDEPSLADIARTLTALDSPLVAEAAWARWSDFDLIGGPLAELVEHLNGDAPDSAGERTPGLAWLTARQLAWASTTDRAVEVLEAARATDHPLVLAELAALEADRGNPLAARELLRAGGYDVDIDLDAEFDPRTADSGFAAELAEEIAPFAAIRPRPMAGRNDKCPCGSGKKYKQCHLGNELHPIEDRAGWLYVKLMRFMQVNSALFPGAIADDIVETVADPDLRAMVHESYLPVDLALFEGGVADWFLTAKESLLPADETEMLRQWIDATRSVYEVERSRAGRMDVIDLANRKRLTIVDTVPDEPLQTGWKIIGRLVPVGDAYRAYGGFLPINDDMVDVMLEGFETRKLETVALTISQIFETAATQDEIQNLFADSLDTGELRELLDEMSDETPD
ncbi:MAG: hypothetical protein ACJA14_002980 [Ilumatobacter sp.]|jgi:hypothetical protein